MPQGNATTIVTDADGWEFDLGEHVTLLWSGGAGQVIGRTEYVHRDTQYLVQYVNADGELVDGFFYDDALDHLTKH